MHRRRGSITCKTKLKPFRDFLPVEHKEAGDRMSVAGHPHSDRLRDAVPGCAEVTVNRELRQKLGPCKATLVCPLGLKPCDIASRAFGQDDSLRPQF